MLTRFQQLFEESVRFCQFKTDLSYLAGMVGIQHTFADCRTATENNGSIRVTVPKPIAEEWDLTDGDSIPFVAEEGSDTAEMRRPSTCDD